MPKDAAAAPPRRQPRRARSREPKPRRPFTAVELDAVRALEGCTFPVGSWEKRFVRDLGRLAEVQRRGDDGAGVTDGQAEWLRKTAHRFRRQVPRRVLAALEGEPVSAAPLPLLDGLEAPGADP